MTAAGRGWTALLLGGSTIAALAHPAAVQAVQDDFDPARFREDLLLIQPRFAPPELLPGRPAGEAASAAAPDPAAEAAFRVQVISLSREEGARRIADALNRRLGVDVDVVPHEGLHSVRAGRFAERAGADRLRGVIAALSRDFAQAFVVADSVAALPDEGPPGADPERIEAPAAPEEPQPEMVRLQGWRVLIGQHTGHTGLQDARDLRARVMARLKRQDVDIRFEEPWYKILVGNFRTSAAAQQFADRCRRLGYPSATRTQGEILIPREEAR